MMYLITATILGVGSNLDIELSVYLFLLPLAVIVPSYIVAIDYWKAVIRVATYLIVFHEKKETCFFHWETRHEMLRKYEGDSILNCQLIPYYICGICCFIVYLVKVKKCFEILIGLGIIIVSLFVIYHYRKNINRLKFIERWEKIKKDEEHIKREK